MNLAEELMEFAGGGFGMEQQDFPDPAEEPSG